MLFNSFLFLFAFLPITLIVYFSLNRWGHFMLGKAWLVLLSIVYYAYFNVRYLPIIVLSILGNYALSQCMLTTRRTWLRGLCFAVGLAGNLGVLVYYKYYDFFAANINAAFGSSFTLHHLLLPLGISFFTFQQLSYVIDSYRRTVPRYKLVDYALFVTFFPQLIAGPIVLHSEIVPQFENPENRHFRIDNFAPGLYALAIGLAKKVLIADTFAKVVEYGYTPSASLNSLEALLVVLAFTFQLYFDFSGYCDMALGLGRMFNINIPINFNSPYKSLDIQEFWQRWHITLSRFFTTYIYFPLGGSRKGLVRTCCNLLVVFLVSGLWHGAGWVFLLWGLMHGAASALYRLCRKRYDGLPAALRWALTFAFVSLAWVFFRAGTATNAAGTIDTATSFHTATRILSSLFSLRFGPVSSAITDAFSTPFGLLGAIAPWITPVWFLGALLLVTTQPNTYALNDGFSPTFKNGFATVALLTISILSLSGVSVFLYYNF